MRADETNAMIQAQLCTRSKGSFLFLSDLLTDHEPVSVLSFISNDLRVRFMESSFLATLG